MQRHLLKPILLPGLTSADWYRSVIGALDASGLPNGLVGIDVGHTHIQGDSYSEVCVAFLSRGGQIEATVNGGYDNASFLALEAFFRRSQYPARAFYRSLDMQSPQINTLLFPECTIVYTFVPTTPWSSDFAQTPKLVLNQKAAQVAPNLLRQKIQAYCDAFTAAHDCTSGIRLVAPATDALEAIFAD